MHQRRLGAVMGRASPDELYDTVVSLVRRFTTRHSPGEVATPEGILPIDGENSQVPPSGGFQGNGTPHHNSVGRGSVWSRLAPMGPICVVPLFRFDPVRVIPELTALSVLPCYPLTDRSLGVVDI